MHLDLCLAADNMALIAPKSVLLDHPCSGRLETRSGPT